MKKDSAAKLAAVPTMAERDAELSMKMVRDIVVEQPELFAKFLAPHNDPNELVSGCLHDMAEDLDVAYYVIMNAEAGDRENAAGIVARASARLRVIAEIAKPPAVTQIADHEDDDPDRFTEVVDVPAA